MDEVIPLMVEGRILPYLDIPFQHASPTVLKAMRRPAHQEKTLERIRKWREICPDLAIRSTFIVGFPGETEEDFTILLDWLKEAKLDRVGCFRYEPVKGARANDLPNPVPPEVEDERWHRFMKAHRDGSARRTPLPPEEKDGRWHRFMKAQRDVCARILRGKVGKRLSVIIDEPGATVAKGRSRYDAPEIDGSVYVASRRPLRAGDIVTVQIERADEYDLHGIVV